MDSARCFNLSFLEEIAKAPPSRDCLQRLFGPASKTIDVLGEETAFAFILAAAKQLTVVCTDQSDVAAMLAPVGQLSLSNQIEEVLEAVGKCIAKCSTPERIVQSNIIPVLHNIQNTKSEISLAHAEFLQACIYAKQYDFAESQVQETWPKPRRDVDSESKLVLRYFYLRGIVHMGTKRWARASRCFSTCVCIPLESSSSVSAIAIAAWKKLVLVSCLQCDFHTPSLSLRLFPKHMSSKLKSYVEDATRSLCPTGDVCPENTSVAVIEDPIARRENPSFAAPKDSVSFYKELASAFEKHDRLAFDSVMKQASSHFENDGTIGLVHCVDAILLRRQVYHIGSMFATISLQELKTQLQTTQEPEELLRVLSEEMAWPVRVEDGWVLFPPNIPDQPSTEIMAHTQRDMVLLRGHLSKIHQESTVKAPRKNDALKDQNTQSISMV